MRLTIVLAVVGEPKTDRWMDGGAYGGLMSQAVETFD